MAEVIEVIIDADEVTLDRLQRMASEQGSDINQFATALLHEGVARADERAREKQEAQSVVEGPFHPFDLEAERTRYHLPHPRSRAEIEAAAEKAVADMDDATRAKRERDGFL